MNNYIKATDYAQILKHLRLSMLLTTGNEPMKHNNSSRQKAISQVP